MSVACFIYNFHHEQSALGLRSLHDAGIEIDCLLAAPWRRLSPAGPDAPGPWPRAATDDLESIAPLYAIDHGDPRIQEITQQHRCRLGVILGARILPRHTVAAFRDGVVNIHPGLAPWNRGLDSHKWAVALDCAQGVTCHLVGARIDCGPLVLRRAMPTIGDSDLTAVRARLREMTIKALSEGVSRSLSRSFRSMEEPWPYHTRMTAKEEQTIHHKFENYRSHYAEMAERWGRYDC